jgi:hypothetical protein
VEQAAQNKKQRRIGFAGFAGYFWPIIKNCQHRNAAVFLNQG